MLRLSTCVLCLSPLLLARASSAPAEPAPEPRLAPGAELADDPQANDPAEPTWRVRRAAVAGLGVGACPSDVVVDLWPPNHKYVDIDLTAVLPPGTVGIEILSITQDEPVDDRGDGHTKCDGNGVGTDVAHLRSERSGLGDGRVYTIEYSAFGGGCSGIVTVTVPHDQSGAEAQDDGQLFDSSEGCK